MEFYVDGSCSNNGSFPNKGGYAVIAVKDNDVIATYKKHCENTTNNREELKAILYVLLNYGQENPIVYSDSAYCVNTFNTWMFQWASKGWIKSDKKQPENLDLIKTYYDFYQKGYRIDLRKIKGHAGHQYNELADKMAKGEI